MLTLGHTVTRFDSTTADGIMTALAGQDVVLFPEFENGDPTSAFDPAARQVLSNFVAGAAGLSSRTTTACFLTRCSVFRWLRHCGSAADRSCRCGHSLCRRTGNASLHNSATHRYVAASLPAKAKTIYSDGAGSVVTLIHPIRRGRDRLSRLGLVRAAPLGGTDGGWLPVLDSAVKEASPKCINPSFEDSPDLTGWTFTFPPAVRLHGCRASASVAPIPTTTARRRRGAVLVVSEANVTLPAPPPTPARPCAALHFLPPQVTAFRSIGACSEWRVQP